MSEIEEVQEQMKADIEAMKDQMTTMMEAMMSIRKMMEVTTAAVATTSAATEVDQTHPSGMNQVSHPVPDVVGQGGELGSTGGPHFAQVQNKHPFPPYGLPPNYIPLNAVHVPEENVDHFAPIPLESQQPQYGHSHVAQPIGVTHEVPRDHALANFEPYPRYATEGKAFGDIPQPNTLGDPQYRPQMQLQP